MSCVSKGLGEGNDSYSLIWNRVKAPGKSLNVYISSIPALKRLKKRHSGDSKNKDTNQLSPRMYFFMENRKTAHTSPDSSQSLREMTVL